MTTHLAIPKSGPQRAPRADFETAIADLPDEQRDILAFWYDYAATREISQRELARMIGVSDSAISQAFHNKYKAGLDNLCQRMLAAKDNLPQAIANPHFIMTSLAKQMFTIFDEARALQTVMLVWGVKGIGKTVIGREYKRRNNHGRTHYYRCSPGLSLNQFIQSLAAALGVSPKRRMSLLQTRQLIIRLLSAGQRLLIVDELHQLFLRDSRGCAVLICEFLREIYDVSECGLVLIGTRAMVSHLVEGTHADALEQLIDRGEDPVELPSKPTRSDAAAAISHYGLDPSFAGETEAAAIVADIFARSGLRKLTRHLRAGAAFAARSGEPYQWRHFVAAQKRHASILKKPASKS